MCRVFGLFLLAFAPACASPLNDPRVGHGIAAEFRPFVDEFEAAWGQRIEDLPITFSREPLADGASAKCTTRGDYRAEVPLSREWREIVVDRTSFESARESTRRILVLHELGHCVLGRRHDARWLRVTVEAEGALTQVSGPFSVMHPSAGTSFGGGDALREHYLRELLGDPAHEPLP